MERLTRLRAQILALLFVLVAVFFCFRLYDLQIIQTGGKTDSTSNFTTWTRVKASRGDLLDTNGNLLAGNRASYDLTINHYVLITADGTNDYLYTLLTRCKEAGIEYNDHFPISKERPFVYTLDTQSSTWQKYFQQYLAFLGNLDSDITAPVLVEGLREHYDLPAEWTQEEVRQVLGLWYELDLRRAVGTLPQYVFLPDVNDQDLASVMELNIPGMNVEATTVREYNTTYAAHILGYVGPMTAEQWEYYQGVEGYDMDAEVGQDGLEAEFEEYLHGVDGLREDTVAIDGTLISSRYLQEPKAGSNVEVSIDINLQRAAEEEMERVFTEMRANGGAGYDVEGGAVVAVEVKTGKVLVCASNPTYNLATFSEDYNKILEQPYDPLFNRALMGTYPPGSTYKMSMVVAGINSGTISSATAIYDKGVFDKYGPGFEVKCLLYTNSRQVHEYLVSWEALMVSCNYFFYELGDRMPIKTIDDTAKALGLGEPTGIELPERIGHRANEQTKAELYTGDNQTFYQADKVLAAIGQSDNRFTPIQLAVYAATLANRGTRYKATFLNRVVSSDYRTLVRESTPSVANVLEITDDAYKAYTEGMYNVAHNSRGTASKVFKNYPIKVGAKTGTAQNGIPGASDNGALVCYAPFEDPQIAIAVYGEKAGGGSYLATVAREILDVYFDVDEVGDVTTNENRMS